MNASQHRPESQYEWEFGAHLSTPGWFCAHLRVLGSEFAPQPVDTQGPESWLVWLGTRHPASVGCQSWLGAAHVRLRPEGPESRRPKPGLCSQTGQPLQQTKSTQPLTPLRINTSNCVLITKSQQQGLFSELRLVLYRIHCDPLNTSLSKSAVCSGNSWLSRGSPTGPTETVCASGFQTAFNPGPRRQHPAPPLVCPPTPGRSRALAHLWLLPT